MDARQEMILLMAKTIREKFKQLSMYEVRDIATHLVDKGIRSKEGFKIKGICYEGKDMIGIIPINYNQEEGVTNE